MVYFVKKNILKISKETRLKIQLRSNQNLFLLDKITVYIIILYINNQNYVSLITKL